MSEARDDARIEAAARALAGLEPSESWPTNGELGGSPTGTRDDEYRDGLREQAQDMLAAADAVDSARAELSRLRGVVEAVQALADEWDEKRRPGMVGISRAIRAALAPVSSPKR